MDKEIKVEITLKGLPDLNNHHLLAVALEEKISHGVRLALADTYPCRRRDVEVAVHVPSF
jgi:hypothetical protein